MASNDNQICIISVMFPVTDDVFAIDVKAKIQEMLANVSDAKIDFAIRSGGVNALQPPSISRPVR